MKNWFKNIGPGTLVAAAFIGPGTVTICTLAGVNFGLNLLWALLLSVFATIILQEMAARLGVVSQRGISEIIRQEIKSPVVRNSMIVLILAAIVVGNAAYEAGNISGGILGLESIFGQQIINFSAISINLLSFAIGIIAFLLLFIGNYKVLEKVLISLVLIMSVSFVISAVLTKPSLLAILKGAFIPKFPEESLLTIIALVGTTIVPYNLFLHASLVKERWTSGKDLALAQKDTYVAISLGGLVSIAIIIAASAVDKTAILNAADLAESLSPLYGKFAKYLLALGLFSAGITSAITAPLAAAYVVKGCFGWSGNLKSKKFRVVWMVILILGVIFSSVGLKPMEIIKFAQVANGMLLPVVAGVLLWIMNRKEVLGKYVNTTTQNIIGLFIVFIALFLGLKSIFKVVNLF